MTKHIYKIYNNRTKTYISKINKKETVWKSFKRVKSRLQHLLINGTDEEKHDLLNGNIEVIMSRVYDENFKNDIMKIDVDVPDGISGEWAVESFVVEQNELSQSLSLIKSGRGVPAGTYKRLLRNRECIMSNTPDEIRDFIYFLRKASGSILINGLGLGVLVKALLEKPDVTDITIIEKSEDVIKLSAATYLVDKRVTIINADAFTWEPPKGKIYDAVWHDIWDNICSDNIEEMKKLHRKYGKRCKYQESWARDICEQYLKEDKRRYYE